MPLTVIENSVFHVSEVYTYENYFSVDLLKANVNEYLKKSLEGKVDKYQISFNFYKYDQSGEEVIDLSPCPKNVDIHFKATYRAFLSLSLYRSYQIEEYEWEINRTNWE